MKIFLNNYFFIVESIIIFHEKVMGLLPEQAWGTNSCYIIDKDWKWIVWSFGTCCVVYWFVVVEYFNGCEFLFQPKMIWNQTQKQQSWGIINIYIWPNNSFFIVKNILSGFMTRLWFDYRSDIEVQILPTSWI